MPLHCWGSSAFGQLGLGESVLEEGKVLSPVSHGYFSNDRTVLDIGCGLHHTVFVLEDGTIWTCGSNDEAQLGRDSPIELGQVFALELHRIIGVSCGDFHTLVINDKYSVFSWGNDQYGQCGRGGISLEPKPIPRLIKSLEDMRVVQVACGSSHSLALTTNGQIYAWGANDHGQLGLGSKESMSKPTLVSSLQGLPVKQITCGRSHSFALSVSGAVFGWGNNSCGQLGLNDERDRQFPHQLKSLRSRKVVYISCGEEHTVAFTKEGGVFTFGCGAHGQLGHNSSNNEINPRQVVELMGSIVTQIGCGRRHTLAHVGASGKLYSFGLGANGQLGNDTTDRRQAPTAIYGPWVGYDATSVNTSSSVIQRIFTGGDQCFVYSTKYQDKKQPLDFRETFPGKGILRMNIDVIQELLHLPNNIPNLPRDLLDVFSSAACWNASFLKSDHYLCSSDDEHFGSSSSNHGVNMDAVREAFQMLSDNIHPRVMQLICCTLKNTLLQSLSSSPPDIEALRFYLIIMEAPIFTNIDYLDSVTMPFSKMFLSLVPGASKVIGRWWGRLQPRFFNRILHVYKSIVTYLMKLEPPVNDEKEVMRRSRAVLVSMKMLTKLEKVNSENNDIIPYFHFYIPEINQRIDIRSDYICWIHHITGQVPVGYQALSFCNYPFSLDSHAKTKLLHVDALMQMQAAMDEVHRRNIESIFLPQIDPVSPCLVLNIRRENIVPNTLDQISKQGTIDLKKPLRVSFVGEDAVDAGGVRKEFFMLILREILNPKYGMFQYYNSRTVWFNDKSFEDRTMYHLVGVICGLAIYNLTIIDLHFPLVLYKKLLGKDVNLEDFKTLDWQVAENLHYLLEYEDTDVEETFDLTFTIGREHFGQLETVELIPGGKDISVTAENKHEYVNRYVDYVLNKSAHAQFEAFNDGFHKVCGGRVLELFRPQELMEMVIGNQNYQWDEFEKNTEYKGIYYRQHQTIIYFWEVFHNMIIDLKKKFLIFLTGSDHIPILGMQALRFIIQSVHGGDQYLPVAHTCFNLLDLPVYQTKEHLKAKLYLAIENAEGFGIA